MRGMSLSGALPVPEPEPEPKPARPATYGHMTVDRWHAEGHRLRGSRVLLDGQDVTDSCSEFDDEAGWVLLWETDPATSKFRVRRHGEVQVRLGRQNSQADTGLLYTTASGPSVSESRDTPPGLLRYH